MEASELCDQLKAKIAQLEDELKATKDSRNDFKGQLEDHQDVLRKLAEHLRVEYTGSVYELEHRLWQAANTLRGSHADAIKPLVAELNQKRDECNLFSQRIKDLRLKIKNCADTVIGHRTGFSPEEAALPAIIDTVRDLRRAKMVDANDMEELARLRLEYASWLSLKSQITDEANQMRATLHFIADELGLSSRNALPERQWFLKQLQELRVKVDDAKKLGFELKDYHAKYQAINKAADEACNFAGLDRSPGPTVQDTVLDTLERLAKHCAAETTDSRIKLLERVCYGAESRSGVSCREINPWRRIEYVLNTMAAELAHLRVQGKVPEAVRTKVWAIQRNLEAEVNDYTHRNETEEVIKILEAIEKKAYEAQNVRAACIKLKELL
jgi:hypothetical protein